VAGHSRIDYNYLIKLRFVVKATECLENHLGSEGLFRKSGSSVRQRQLRVSTTTYN
jgi:hypothetical protein